MNSSEYQVTIKSANQKVDDYATKCNPDWTVRRLKQHISETHINKPKVEDQRLIYAGNLLKDTNTLKQIFFRDSLCTELTNASKTDFTIHLVCHTPTQKSTNNNPISGATQAGASSRTQLNSTAPAPNVPASSNVSGVQRENNRMQSNASASRPNQPTYVSINNQMNQFPNQQSTPFNATQQAEMVLNFMQSDQMRQQMAAFQQLAYVVAAQIVNNLNNTNPEVATETSSESASQLPNLLPVISTLNVQTTTTTNNHITNSTTQLLYAADRQPTQFVATTTHDSRTGVPQNENINPENNANAPGPAEPAGAQFGFGAQIQVPAPVLGPVRQPAPQPDQEVPLMQHDVIDWVYYCSRVAVLMVALYVHASMFRLLFIVGLLAVAYFFNRRRIIPTRQEPQPAQQEMNAADGQQQVAQEDVGLRRRNVIANRDENDNVGVAEGNANETPVQERVQEEAGPNRIPFLKLCYLVVTDFLASLVPE